jgi:transcriptional regulator with XRE-family HTH domain
MSNGRGKPDTDRSDPQLSTEQSPSDNLDMVRGQKQPLHKKLRDRLRKLRKLHGHSYTSLAEAAGVSRTAVRNIEEARSVPGVDLVESLARALGVSPSWLAYGEGPEPDLSAVIPAEAPEEEAKPRRRRTPPDEK